jgi:hypothetical protein
MSSELEPVPKHRSSSVPQVWRRQDSTTFQGVFEVELDDHLAIAYRSRDLLPARFVLFAVGLLALFLALVAFFDVWEEGDVGGFVLRLAATVAAAVLLAAMLLRPARRGLRAVYRNWLRREGRIGQTVTSAVGRNGVRFMVGGQTVNCPWPSLHDLEEDEGTFYFWMSRTTAHPWPARLFASEQERQHFRDKVREWSGRPFGPPILARMGSAARSRGPGE